MFVVIASNRILLRGNFLGKHRNPPLLKGNPHANHLPITILLLSNILGISWGVITSFNLYFIIIYNLYNY